MDCVKTGRLIAKLRKEKGLTQKNVADALGISNKTISKWETGLGCPDLSLWPDLSTILGAEIYAGNHDNSRKRRHPVCQRKQNGNRSRYPETGKHTDEGPKKRSHNGTEYVHKRQAVDKAVQK